MAWIRAHWRWVLLNGIAAGIFAVVVAGHDQSRNTAALFDPVIESGKWAVRFLLVSLAMTPLNSLFGWRWAIPLRKPAGLWAFGFAGLHFVLSVRDFEPLFYWLAFPMQTFILLGVLGLLILSAMALTSNRWAMKWLGKSWKRLHRLVYIAGCAVIVHAMLATTTKRVFFADPQVIDELRLYLVVLVGLLAVRVPLVRNRLKKWLHFPAALRRKPHAAG